MTRLSDHEVTPYERVTYRGPTGRRRRIFLREPMTVRIGSAPCLAGIEVDREGVEIHGGGRRPFDERRHLIDLSLVLDREPYRMSLHYGELEPTS